jgi:phosphoribosylformylglycinamidine cyclo-ligase
MSPSYRDAGVDIEAGNLLAKRLGPLARGTLRPEILSGIGGFAGVCRLPSGLREPLLVSSTDGVGTKLKVAFATGRHGSVGIDLVAMGVNDVLTVGADPLFFLDYFATGKLDVELAEEVVSGVVEGCKQAGCALIGGETAEMPDMYPAGEYDLAGFAVGAVEREKLIDGKRCAAGDVVIGLPSTGLHSNGYSLARRVLLARHRLDEVLPDVGRSLADELLEPTRIYVKPVLRLLEKVEVRALAHITGGGLIDNPPRVVPEGLAFRFQPALWTVPPIMQRIAKEGAVPELEMRRTFNMGLGLLVIVPSASADAALELLVDEGGPPPGTQSSDPLGRGPRRVGELVSRRLDPVEFV